LCAAAIAYGESRKEGGVGTNTKIAVAAVALLMPAVVVQGLRAGDLPASRSAIEPPVSDTLPSALPEQPAREHEGRPSLPPPAIPAPGRLIRLAQSLALSLRNVETVQANLSVRTATVARFEALKAFIPLMDLPQLQVGFSRVTGPAAGNQSVIFPDITDGVPLLSQPGLVNAELNRFNIFLPLDPSGHITALPIAEEGIRAKELMEQLVRRAQAVLAAQRYFEAKQIGYGQRVADAGAYVARETLGLVERKLREKQAHDVELSQARVDVGRARVFVADLGKAERNAERRLGVAVHQCRLLVPQELGPVPIEPESAFAFDLAEPDLIDLSLVPDFPRCREDAVQLAKRQRLEVRLMIVGLRIARLQQLRDKTRLLGMGQLPLGLSFKNTTNANGGIALGLIFGSLYDLPVVNLSLWANIGQARLDVIRSQLDLEKSLLEVTEDAGSSWDRWQQAVREWEQREAEYRLRIEYRDRQARLYEEKQSIRLDVLAAEVDLLQGDANRWTAWSNLQLARLDILRATELLLDYIEKAGIAAVPPVIDAHPKPGHGHGFLYRMVHMSELNSREEKEIQ
jgi:outer membrane protein TolC